MKTLLLILVVASAAVLLLSFLVFLLVFYSPKRKPGAEEDLTPLGGKSCEPFRDLMLTGMRECLDTPHEDVYITSFDGLKLHGRYYEFIPGAPMELMMHGYRGTALRDFCLGLRRCKSLGHNALVIEERGSGQSDGCVISFGINERRDCLSWVEYMVERFGPDCQIILTGISMGASTVLMAGGMDLPKNVVGILADCGFTSAKAIIEQVMGRHHMPAKILYPLVKLGARLFGGVDLEECSSLEAMKECRVPVIFFHGEADHLVPCDMSRENFEACIAPKRILTVPGAGHGLSYLVQPEEYVKVLGEFAEEHWYHKTAAIE